MSSGWIIFFGVLVTNMCGWVALWLLRKFWGWGCITSTILFLVGAIVGPIMVLRVLYTIPPNIPIGALLGLFFGGGPLLLTHLLGKWIAKTRDNDRKDDLQHIQAHWAYVTSIYSACFVVYVIHNVWPVLFLEIVGYIIALCVLAWLHVKAEVAATPMKPSYP